MKDQHRINYLLNKYLSEDISIDEHDELFAMIADGGFDTIIGNRMEDEYNTLPMDGEAGLPPHVAQEIIRNIKLSDKHTEALLPTIALRRNRWIRWVAAASVILILVTGGLIYNQLEQEPVQENLSAIIPDDQLLKTSSSGKPVQVVLKDGSKVLLQPNSTLYYSTRFSDKKREVILDGEAFFTVKRDPSKPFLVFYHKIVTKVLGTSFNIRTNAQTKNLEVAVKTGKVQVFENQHFLPNGLNGKTVIVTPNQKAIYNNQMESLETALVDIPLPIAEKADAEKRVIEKKLAEMAEIIGIKQQTNKDIKAERKIAKIEKEKIKTEKAEIEKAKIENAKIAKAEKIKYEFEKAEREKAEREKAKKELAKQEAQNRANRDQNTALIRKQRRNEEVKDARRNFEQSTENYKKAIIDHEQYLTAVEEAEINLQVLENTPDKDFTDEIELNNILTKFSNIGYMVSKADHFDYLLTLND